MKDLDDEDLLRIANSLSSFISSYMRGNTFNKGIVSLAKKSGAEKFLPESLTKWEDSDFRYSSSSSQFIFVLLKNGDKKIVESFLQNTYDNLKKFQTCRRSDRGTCDIPRNNRWTDANCLSCPDYINNYALDILKQYITELGFLVDGEGFVRSKSGINIEQQLDNLEPEISSSFIEIILPADIRGKGKVMSELYTYLYCVENSLRIFIDIVLKEKLGSDYGSNIVINSAQKRKIKERQKEEKSKKWLPIRGDNILFYLDFSELGTLIQNNWEYFSDYFPDQAWIKVKISDIATYRNLVAHNSYVDSDGIDFIKATYIQILKQIRDKVGEKINA